MYDVSYFIRKFEAIPEELWCINARIDNCGRRCAHGHCIGMNEDDTSDEEKALVLIAKTHFNLEGFAQFNNSKFFMGYNQDTPKKRILAVLYDIRDKELSEANVIEAAKIIKEDTFLTVV